MTSSVASHLLLFSRLIVLLIVCSLVHGQVNVALNKPASQTSDLEWNGFFWTADKAVDGCLLQDDPENQQCCSSSLEELGDNFWSVDLGETYSVESIIVLGRSDTPTQLENFQIYGQEASAGQEFLIFDSLGENYGDGTYTVTLETPRLTRHVVIRRPGILTLCEVQVFVEQADTTTTTTAEATSTGASCPAFTYGEFCDACGNCLNNEPCDVMDGTCVSGCAAGYFGTICNLECPSGLYGPGCFGLCGNCLNGQPCDAVTGQCTLGCAPGWTTSLCNETCPDGSYGFQCASFCGSCMNSEPCDKESGICTSGCAAGWTGILCDTLVPTSPPLTAETVTSAVTSDPPAENVALNKLATQFSTLDYFFLWTADKAVDGCLLRDDPDNQQCCSATEGGPLNFWTVDLQEQYLVSRIVVTGRPVDFSGQLENFTVYTRQEQFLPELEVYDNTGQPYNDGIFTIDIPVPSLVQYVTLRRPSGSIMVICEVEVFAFIEDPATTSTTFDPTTTTTTESTTTTASPTFTTTIPIVPTSGQPTAPTADENVALNKPATQFSSLDYIFFWTADKAVDGCLLRDDPDNQQCCSATEGGSENFWTVDLQEQYLVSRIVVTGRPGDFSGQLENFTVYTRQEQFFPELEVYDNTGQPYNDGIFIIDIPVPSLVQYVTLRRPSGSIMVICEVEVFAFVEDTTTTSTTLDPTTTTTEIATTTTVSQTFTTTIPTVSAPGQTSPAADENVALNKPATQFSTLDYFFLWTADKAVDGCLLRDDPDNQQCCSATEGGPLNFWTVDLQEQYLVSRIVVTGRPADVSNQLENFVVFTRQDDFSPELEIYNNTGQPYNDGIFNVELSVPSLIQFVTVRRPTGTIMVLCEVEVYADISNPVMTTTLETSTSPQESTEISTEGSCPSFTYGEACDPCGNCLNSEPCDENDGTCASGCAAGYFGTICDLECPAGLYGPGCFEVCGNCLSGQPCNGVTGQCTLGCAPGWTTSLCNETCPDGSYGFQCASFCGNCMNNEPCDKESGICTSGCAAGWTGILCDALIPTFTTTIPTAPTSEQTTVTTTAENVALNKPATQFSTLDYFFLWTADKAVDGCLLRDDPDNQQCCSATEGGPLNFWTVDLQEQYLVSRIVVTGRPSDFSGQLENFIVYTRQEQFFPELEIYNNTGQPYNDGIFTIELSTPSLAQFVTLRRPSGSIMVICEIQVFALIEDVTITSTTLEPATSSTTTTTEMATTTTVSPVFTTTIPTELTSGQTIPPTADENVAINKPATQFSTLDYIFFWTADKAVDGCLLRDDPDNQQCCSATEGGPLNFWTVDLQEQYLVSKIVVTGRPADVSNQLENFVVFTRQDDFSPELEIYNNTGQPYNDGIFNIELSVPSLIQFVTVRRPTGTIMVLCEVEVYAVVGNPVTTTIEPSTSQQSTEMSTAESCPPFTYGESCDPCGNCLNNEPCDNNDGTCPSGCAAGYFGTVCDLECPAGLYGPGCFGLCGNCLNGQPCNGITGECILGCAPGWTTSLCNEPCPDGSYGFQCASFCGNCMNSEPCDKESGICTSGCAAGWTGILCDTLITTFTTTVPTAPTSGQTTVTIAGENVALNKPASQFSTLDYFFLWTADKAVDGCLLRDDPDNQQCCSATEGGPLNFWTVDLQEQYLVSRIVVTGRPADFAGQLENFAVYARQEQFSPELEVYNNTGQPYNDGIFTIDLLAPSIVQYVTLRRPSGSIMVICEVEVFVFIDDTTTTSTTVDPVTTTTERGTTTTVSNTSNTFTTTIPTVPTTGQTTTPTAGENVALNKPATQFSTLDYFFLWTADKAVDGCLLRDDPDNQQCCSATEGGPLNFWTVDLQEQFLVSRIVVTGRPADFSGQLENFTVYTRQEQFFPELKVYDNTGQPYSDGIFTIDIPVPSLVQYITLRRPSGSIMVICEVEVFASGQDTSTTSTTLDPTTTTIDISTTSTTAAPFTTTIPSAPTSGQTTQPSAENVALNKPATQFSTVDFIFLWTADKAVDGCLLRDDPDNQQCCSATEGGFENFWTVDLQEQYLVSRIVVTGRPTDFSNQLENFVVYIKQDEFSAESLVYDNFGQPYNDGIFVIDILTPSPAQFVTLRRPLGSIMVICEVEVFAILEQTTTTSDPTTTTTEMVTTTTEIATSTVSPTITTTIPTAPTSGQTTPPTAGENVALNKPATQFSTLDYIFLWTADKAVDGCLLRDDPDNQQCCSATEGGLENFWTVDLQEQYVVSRIVVTGRPADFSNQLENFVVYIKQNEFSAESQVYDNFGQPYNDGIFVIDILTPSLAQYVTLRRPLGSIMVICEVGVFAVLEQTTTTSTTLDPPPTTTEIATTTTEIVTTTTVSPTITTTIPTAPTSGQTTPPTADENVALNKPATQFSTLDYIFLWTADKAVDGCLLRDDPDNQQCCSATEGGLENFWTVDLQEQYVVSRIVVTGRPADFSNQLENFVVYIKQDEFSAESQVYDNFGQPYNDGIFVIDILTPSPAQYVTLRRPLGSIMVICEVEVFAVLEQTTTTSTTLDPTTTTTEIATTTTEITTATTVSPTITTTIPTAPTSGQTTSPTADNNIALNKPATQFSTLDYFFLWTADKAVDGCLLRDDPDNQQCCSATEGGSENFWTVDLLEQYPVSRIVVTGRPTDFSNQLENFVVYIKPDEFSAESQVYDNFGQPYNDGIFVIDLPAPSPAQFVTLRRPLGSIMVICEVEVYAEDEPATTTSTIFTTTSTTIATSVTAESCPENTYGDGCTPCGNCLTFLPCDSVTGACGVGCLPGWQPPVCNTPCDPGYYGIDCELTCGACLFGVPCDVITGVCSGACAPEWQGDNCDIPITTTLTASIPSSTSLPEEPTTTIAADMNVALNKPATQFSTVDFIFLWSADKAVDGCLLRDDPDNQQCCSATEGGFENFWTVDLQEQYLVSRIVVTGRPADNSVQLEGFLLYITESPSVPEILLYNNSANPYNEGVFIIEVQPPQIVQNVTVRRPSGTIIVLCEVEVFGVLSSEPSSPAVPIVNGTDLPSTMSSLETTQTPTHVSPEGSSGTPASSSIPTSTDTQTSSSVLSSLSTQSEVPTETSVSTSSQATSQSSSQSSISTSSRAPTRSSSPTISQSSTPSSSQVSTQSSTPTPSQGATQSSTASPSQDSTQGSTPSKSPTQSSTQGQTQTSSHGPSGITSTTSNMSETTAGDAVPYDGSVRTVSGWIVVVSSSLLAVLLS